VWSAHTYRSGARAYICAARGQRCVIALPIEFSYTGMASLMHKMTEPNSVIVRFTKRIRPRVVNIARRCERQCHIVTTEFSGARKYAVIRQRDREGERERERGGVGEEGEGRTSRLSRSRCATWHRDALGEQSSSSRASRGSLSLRMSILSEESDDPEAAR